MNRIAACGTSCILDTMSLPLPTSLKAATNILIAGAGGGFDVFAGLPLLAALHELGKNVILANLSFTYLGGTDAEQPVPGTFQITPTTKASGEYFPEGVLARFLEESNIQSPIYAFDKAGVLPVRAGYEYLVRKHAIDAIVLIDGGTDIVMRGDEAGLGTPEEDMVSLAAVSTIDVPTRLVYCIGFGIDSFHGVCHAHFLENVAALSVDGGFLGCTSVLRDMPEARFYLDAVRYSEVHMPSKPSIVNTSIASAIEGKFGDHHRTERTRCSELFINPLMSLYWAFDLPALAQRSLYLHKLHSTSSIWDVQAIIRAFHGNQKQRKPRPIPH